MNMHQENTSATNQRRCCKCKNSSCLKLNCECFAASSRCNGWCHCNSCKNQDNDQQKLGQTIVDNSIQKVCPSSLPALRTIEVEPVAEPSRYTPPSFIMTCNETSGTVHTAKEASIETTCDPPRPICACDNGKCTADCPCLSLFGSCSPCCQCNGCLVMPIQIKRTKGCSCKKSNCLKLYCECLAAHRMCDYRCNCEDCRNRPETVLEREQVIAAILERNPLAFEPKVASGSTRHLRGCNCRKSGCMKNYCECHQAGVACTSRCTCLQCRNTDTFVSAKKMLVFAGVNADDSSLRGTYNRSLQRKVVKRPPRGSTKKKDLQDGMQTSISELTKTPTALDLLSRSASVAPSTSSRGQDSAMDNDNPTATLKKRPSSDPDHMHTPRESVVTPAFAKRKYTRRNAQNNNGTFKSSGATAPMTELPNVEDTLTNLYDARSTEGVGDPELTILCRSLLHTALAVELANEERKALSSNGPLPVDQQALRVKAKPQGAFDLSDGREALSPTAAGLFCEEEYCEVTAEDNTYFDVATSAFHGNDIVRRSTTIDPYSNSQSRQTKEHISLSAMQERAVLQELSVWLRNMTAHASLD